MRVVEKISFIAAYLVLLILGGCAYSRAPDTSQAPPSAPPVALPQPPKVSATPPAPAPAPAPLPIPVSSISEKVSFTSDTFFQTASAKLSSEARATLDLLATKIAGVKLEMLIVVGHAAQGEASTKAATQKLSMARAGSVKSYLISKGVENNRIYIDGKGANQPIAGNQTAGGRAKNRRAEIEVVGSQVREAQSGIDPSTDLPRGVVAVLFGTTRGKSGDDNPYKYFTSTESKESDRLTLGRVMVKVPPDRQKGDLEEPGYFSATLELLTTGSVASFIGITPVKAANPRTDFSFAGPIEEYDKITFRETLKRHLSKSAHSKQAIVYIHGFANSFKDAAFRTAQFGYDLSDTKYDIVPILFSWPSDPSGFNYIGAGDRVWSAGKHLAKFLDHVVDATGVGKVHIVAHSKGAQVLGIALDEMRVQHLLADSGKGPPLVSKFNQILLAAPDIRADDFEPMIMPAVASRHRVTNYVSSNDAALRASKRANSDARAGDSGQGLRLVQGVQTIDVTAANYRPGGHSSFADSPAVLKDIQLQLQGKMPEERGLQRIPRKDLSYWVLR